MANKLCLSKHLEMCQLHINEICSLNIILPLTTVSTRTTAAEQKPNIYRILSGQRERKIVFSTFKVKEEGRRNVNGTQPLSENGKAWRWTFKAEHNMLTMDIIARLHQHLTNWSRGINLTSVWLNNSLPHKLCNVCVFPEKPLIAGPIKSAL